MLLDRRRRVAPHGPARRCAGGWRWGWPGMAALGVGGLDYASLGCAVSAVNVLRRVVEFSAGVVGGRGPVPAAPGHELPFDFSVKIIT